MIANIIVKIEWLKCIVLIKYLQICQWTVAGMSGRDGLTVTKHVEVEWRDVTDLVIVPNHQEEELIVSATQMK